MNHVPKYGSVICHLIVRHLCRALKKEGWQVAYVYDGGDERVKVECEEELMEAVFAVDIATIHFTSASTTQVRKSWVQLVFGNAEDGSDLISDYMCKYEDFNAIVDSFPEALEQL